MNRLLDQDTNRDYLNDFEAAVTVVSQKTPVIIMSDIPEYDYNPLRAAWLEYRKIFGMMSTKSAPLESNLEANDIIKSLVRRVLNVKYVDITSYVTILLNNNELIYRDQNHFNPYDSREVGEMFIQDQTLKIDN